MTPAGCSGIWFSGGPGGGIEPNVPFDIGPLVEELCTVSGELLGPSTSRPLPSFKQSGVTGVKGVRDDVDEDEELDERPFFSATSWSAFAKKSKVNENSLQKIKGSIPCKTDHQIL